MNAFHQDLNARPETSQKKARGLMKEGPLVQMLDRQRVQQAAADEAKKLVEFLSSTSSSSC
jgi:hypothetical protein